MEKVWEKVREKIPSKPLKAIVITHFHAGMNCFLTVQFENQTLFPSNMQLSWSYFRKNIVKVNICSICYRHFLR